jgi:sugar O-acyltransferase (sialic acid O-acetyltransferase NeuD family)
MCEDRLIIWGASGHALVVADIVKRAGLYEIVGFVDDTGARCAGSDFCGGTVLGGREALGAAVREGVRYVIVAIGDCDARTRLADFALGIGLQLATAIHPSAVMAPDVSVGSGSVLAAGSVLCPSVSIADNVIINTCASIDHESRIEDGAHVGPGARLTGRVSVGRAAWIGAGAVVTPGVSIGARAHVGAGSLVLHDVPPGVVAYGSPARVVRERGALTDA